MNFPFSQVKVGLYLSHAQLLERTDENGTQDLQKGWFLRSYSGCPFVC